MQNTNINIQGEKYWKNRKSSDTHLDWGNGDGWIDGFWQSKVHSHRKLIIQALEKLQPFESLLEVGSSCGPNLAVINDNFPRTKLIGLDINRASLLEGMKKMPDVRWVLGRADQLNFSDKSIDVILTDAVLIYTPPNMIVKTINEFLRVAKKGVVLCEWHDKDKSPVGEIVFYHWVRNYERLLELCVEETVKVNITKIKAQDWKSANWTKYGYIISILLQ